MIAGALVDGAVAGLLSAAVLAWRGKAELRRPAAPLNAPAHWIFDRESLHSDRASTRHTLTGLAVHQASSVFWALFYQALLSRRRRVDTAGAVADAAVVTAVASVVDLKLVPERLTPGFQHRLTKPSVAGVYVAFAIGLAVSAMARRTTK